jgi:hypothetical protein
MEGVMTIEKSQKNVKRLSWILIVISAILIIRGIFGIIFYSFILSQISSSDNPNHSAAARYIFFLIEVSIEFVIFTILIMASINIGKFKIKWRELIIYCLIAATIYLIISTIINNQLLPSTIISSTTGNEKQIAQINSTYSLVLTIILPILLSVYFIYAIFKLSKEEIRLLFK